MVTVTTQPGELFRKEYEHEVHLLFTGDFCPDSRIEELIAESKNEDVFGEFSRIAANCDLSLTNLECPLTECNKPILKDGPVLKGSIKAAKALRESGFNSVCLANNHIMDHGVEGFEDTINILEVEGLFHTGAGMNLDVARKPLIREINNIKIAILNIAEVEFSIAHDSGPGAAPLDIMANIKSINNTRKQCDILILVIHGGHEFYSLPSPRMKETYRFFADLGVDAIIGHHAHAHSGYEIYNDVPIFYNLGNLLFDRKESRDVWYRGFAVQLNILKNGLKNIYIIPYYQCRKKVGIEMMESKDLDKFNADLIRLNDIISDDYQLQNEFNQFICDHRIHYLAPLLGLNKIERQLVRMNLLTKFLVPRKKLLNGLSMARCQSHRDAFIEILKRELN